MKYLFLLIFILFSPRIIIGQYQRGFYIDLKNHKHEGLIHEKRTSSEIVIFKEFEDLDKKQLTPNQLKEFAILQDTFVVRSVYNGGINPKSRKSFVRISGKGKIEIYDHLIKGNRWGHNMGLVDVLSRNTDYYIRKENNSIRVFSTESGPTINSLKELLPYVEDDEEIADKIHRKEYKVKDWRQLITDYNNRSDGQDIAGELIIYRRSKKELKEPVKLFMNDHAVAHLTPNTLTMVNINDIYNIRICSENSECLSFSGYSDQINYIEVELEKGDVNPRLMLVALEVGEYYEKQIKYFMDKASKK